MAPQKSAKKSETAVFTVEKRGRGRPATGRERGVVLRIRVSETERETLQAAADAAGISLHAHVRKMLQLGS